MLWWSPLMLLCLPLPDDVLTKDAGECVICLEELLQGDTIARLPCLCIYHKRYHEGTARRVARDAQGHLRLKSMVVTRPSLAAV